MAGPVPAISRGTLPLRMAGPSPAMTVWAGFIQGGSADGRWELAMTGYPPLAKGAFPTASGLPIFTRAGSPATAINGPWNKRSGPGGSARRLHHLGKSAKHGGDTGSTRAVKMYLSLGMVPPLSGHMTSANDNTEALAVAA